MYSVAEGKRYLLVGERLLSSLHWQRQDRSPWCILTCVLCLCAVCAEIQPGYLGAAQVTVHSADLSQKLQAMLAVHLYYTILPCLQCLLEFCWHAAVAAKSIHHILNTAVMDANFLWVFLVWFFFEVKVIFKASPFSLRSYPCSWKITFHFHLFTFLRYYIFDGFSSSPFWNTWWHFFLL